MHRVPLVVALAASGALVAPACGLLDFDVTQNIPEQRIAGDPVAAAAGQLVASGGAFPNPFTFDINLEQETKARDTGPADSVRIRSLRLFITDGSPTPNFDWLDDVRLFVSSTRQGSMLPRVELAGLAPVPKGQREISLLVDGRLNLLPYINEGIRVSSEARARVPAQDVRFAGVAVFRVNPI